MLTLISIHKTLKIGNNWYLRDYNVETVYIFKKHVKK